MSNIASRLSAVPFRFASRLSAWVRENQQAGYELLAVFILSTSAFFLLGGLNILEDFYEFTRKFEKIQLDETIVYIAIFSFFLMIFAIRRWVEAMHRLEQANTDSLTGLFNRRKGWEVLKYEMARAKRYRRPLSLTMFDLDFF